jgi:membrane associated rhomboid family serine protease
MLTSSFSHGSWDHVIGNLFFFFAFAAAVEMIIGPLAFLGVIVAMAFGTNIFYSLAMLKVAEPMPTVGLSGIVMGMMTMLAFFMPTAKIRCFYWFLIKVGTVTVSAWVLALFFVGFDIYNLLTQEEMGTVNLVAHVSGALIGLTLASIFFRRQRREFVLEAV